MDNNLITMGFSVACFVGAYLITKPQSAKNSAFQQSIDHNTEVLENLTILINEIRTEHARATTNIDNLFHRYAELKDSVDVLNNVILQCRGDDKCYKK